ncbi:MAG: four helix bundle protein [Candidatus Doudnabacteria bacterium]|nr:four helix bundle protein [Candidatus Doudnabacteria bacterium]
MQIKSYKDLIVWQKSMDLVVDIYKISEKFPKEELYGLTSQIRRCAVSIPSNIAEGNRRGSKKDFSHFLTVSFGSGSELETQIEIVKRLPFGSNLDFTKIDALLLEIMKMLNKLIASLQPTN